MSRKTWFTVSAKVDQLVGTHFRALVADDAGLRARFGLDLQPKDTAETRRNRPALLGILEGKGRLWGVLQREQHPLEQINEKQRPEQP